MKKLSLLILSLVLLAGCQEVPQEEEVLNEDVTNKSEDSVTIDDLNEDFKNIVKNQREIEELKKE